MNFKDAFRESRYLMNASKIAILALVLIGLLACATKAYQGQRGPICLGPVCLDKDIWKEADPFFEKYGVGVERRGKFPAYWYKDCGVFVYISRYHGENRPIDTIAVSKYPYYSNHALPPKQSFGPLVTETGLGLGTSYEEIVATYGKPNKVYVDHKALESEIPDEWTVDLKDVKVVLYESIFGELDYGTWSLFFFEKDKLIAIELSNAL